MTRASDLEAIVCVASYCSSPLYLSCKVEYSVAQARVGAAEEVMVWEQHTTPGISG